MSAFFIPEKRPPEATLKEPEKVIKITWDQIRGAEVVHFSSVTQSFPTLCDPMDCSMPGLPVLHQPLELAQTHVHWVGDAIQPSHPLSSPSPPAFNLSQHQGLFKWVPDAEQRLYTHSNPIINPTLEPLNSLSKPPRLELKFSRLGPIVSLFAWQKNKAILFYFTQNSFSKIEFGTGAQMSSFWHHYLIMCIHTCT